MQDLHYVVVLCRPEGPVNVGMVSRLCRNVGVDTLRLVQPQCDIASPEARMFAHHAQDLLQQCEGIDSLENAVKDCDWVVGTTARRRRDTLERLSPHHLTTQAKRRGARRVALVFGSERDGLDRRELSLCDAALILQTPGPYPSYNLSQAVAITLYLACCPREEAAEDPVVLAASHGCVSRLYDHWLATLRHTGYFRRADSARFAPKLRRLIDRWQLTERDINILWGMLAHFGDKRNAVR